MHVPNLFIDLKKKKGKKQKSKMRITLLLSTMIYVYIDIAIKSILAMENNQSKVDRKKERKQNR